MKKLIAILLAAILTLSLCACGVTVTETKTETHTDADGNTTSTTTSTVNGEETTVTTVTDADGNETTDAATMGDLGGEFEGEENIVWYNGCDFSDCDPNDFTLEFAVDEEGGYHLYF